MTTTTTTTTTTRVSSRSPRTSAARQSSDVDTSARVAPAPEEDGEEDNSPRAWVHVRQDPHLGLDNEISRRRWWSSSWKYKAKDDSVHASLEDLHDGPGPEGAHRHPLPHLPRRPPDREGRPRGRGGRGAGAQPPAPPPPSRRSSASRLAARGRSRGRRRGRQPSDPAPSSEEAQFVAILDQCLELLVKREEVRVAEGGSLRPLSSQRRRGGEAARRGEAPVAAGGAAGLQPEAGH